MEPTGAETETILEQLALGFGSLRGRADATYRRLEVLHDFARVDERFEALTAEMRSGFAVMHDGFAEMRRRFDDLERGGPRRRPKRDR